MGTGMTFSANISAERHLSKISYENFNSPLPPLTFKAIIIFRVKPIFTSAQGPTVNGYINGNEIYGNIGY